MYKTSNKTGRSFNADEKSPFWKGGRRISNFGYVLVRKKDHPFCHSDGYIPEHRIIMEQHLRRYLTPEEAIHHINGIKTDNRLENLEIMTRSEHGKLHSPTIDKRDRKCLTCGSDKTYIRDGKYEQWCSHPVTRERWICRNCYATINRLLKKLKRFMPPLGEARFKLSEKGIEDVVED